MKFVSYGLALTFLCIININTKAQSSDPEFRKGWLLNATVTNGVVTNFKSSAPDLYTGGVAVTPQFTIIENRLRIGANIGAVYNSKKISGMFGPMAAIKLKTLNAAEYGSIANLHLILEANWGTNQQQMAGGGIGFELLKRAHIGVTAQRDYYLNSWWLQSFIAIKLNKAKKQADEYSR